MEQNDNWAQAESPEVGAGKAAYAEATAIQDLRTQLAAHAAGAVRYGVDRDWVNTQLAHLGATPVSGGRTEYRMNIPISGAYGWRCTATSRTEALAKFMEQVKRISEAGKITADGSYDNVYDLTVTDEVATFYSGPEDPSTDTADVLDLDGLKAGIRLMVCQGVQSYGWNYQYANRSLASMGLEALPNAVHKSVQVPVTGTAEVSVLVFEGDGDEEMQIAAAGLMARMGSVYIKPTEIGTVTLTAAEPEGDDEDEDSDVAF